MRVLDHGDAQPLLEQMRNRALQQGGLAGAAPSREANHFHHRLPKDRPEPALNPDPCCIISECRESHANVMGMMKIEKAPIPLIVPNADDPRLTEPARGTDQ